MPSRVHSTKMIHSLYGPYKQSLHFSKIVFVRAVNGPIAWPSFRYQATETLVLLEKAYRTGQWSMKDPRQTNELPKVSLNTLMYNHIYHHPTWLHNLFVSCSLWTIAESLFWSCWPYPYHFLVHWCSFHQCGHPLLGAMAPRFNQLMYD